MSKDTELQRLEQFVEKLLAKFEELKKDKKQLLQDLSERDALIAGLQGDISSKDSERSEISARVNKLVDQIEEWELSLDETEATSEPVDEEEDEDEDNSEEEVEAGLDEGEEEGRVQHNLFSMSE